MTRLSDDDVGRLQRSQEAYAKAVAEQSEYAIRMARCVCDWDSDAGRAIRYPVPDCPAHKDDDAEPDVDWSGNAGI